MQHVADRSSVPEMPVPYRIVLAEPWYGVAVQFSEGAIETDASNRVYRPHGEFWVVPAADTDEQAKQRVHDYIFNQGARRAS